MFDEHKKTLGLLAVLTVLMIALFWIVKPDSGLTSFATPVSEGEFKRPSRASIKYGKDYSAILKTSRGEIKIDLYELDAAYTVTNFIYLAENDFYDGSTFHRVLPGSLIQSGAPASGEGNGPGYTIKDELNNHRIVRGTVAMATEDSKTHGSQFFISEKELPELDGLHNVFGEVVSGFEVIDQIDGLNLEDNGLGEISRPTSEVIIEDVEIIIE